MKIENDKVVTIDYVLTAQEDSRQLDTTREPLAYLHGHGNILLGVEMALDGKEANDRVQVQLPAGQAYGLKRSDFVERVPLKYLAPVKKAKIRVGSAVRFTLNDDVIEGTVVKMGKFNADVDMNHPFAGLDVCFDIKVVDVRDASAEERNHGHAHGDSGCQH